MKTPELQLNTSNLQTLENEISLTKQELEDFRKLPKEEQEKQKQAKLANLSDLQNKLDLAIQEAIKTGELDEAKKLKEELEREVQDLEQQIKATELPPIPEGLEGAIRIEVTIGGKSKEELIKELKDKNIALMGYAESMIDSPDFTTSRKQERLDLIIVSVKHLGFPEGAKTKEIYKKAKSLGLELCPAEVGLQLCLQYNDQLKSHFVVVAMESIINLDGELSIFGVNRRGNGRDGLDSYNGRVDNVWGGDRRFVFVHRK